MLADLYPLMPPADLILENRIGAEPNTDILFRFDEIGRGIAGEMIRDGFLRADHSVLDVGCGLGRVARALAEFLEPPGSYCGIDVVKSSIDWCAEHYSRIDNFRFVWADLYSAHYNPDATIRAREYRFPLDDRSVDRIISTSLFTHLVPEDADHYIAEMARVLKPGGQMWNTFCLLDAVSTPLAICHPSIPMPISIPHGRVAHAGDHEALVGLDVAFVVEAHVRHGLEIADIRNGAWSGRKDDVRASYQDVVIARKPG
jgi:SAM-dependent methyltransferase